MRLLELEITNVRGVPHIVLRPEGKNLLIWGPNGSGKSAVVDALDFLLTGRISRLMGEGTAGITLAKHGPHIGSKPEDARVRAILMVPGLDKPVEVSRCVAQPNVLDCPKAARSYLAPVLEIARRGQHVLTRREILRYITSDAGTRAGRMQALLDLTDVEDTRKALVKVQNDTEKEVASAQSAVAQAKGVVNGITHQTGYTPQFVLDMVNQLRIVLGGEPLKQLDADSLKDGISILTGPVGDNVPNLTLAQNDSDNLLRCFDAAFQGPIISCDAKLRGLLAQVHADDSLLRALAQAELTESGLKLIDDSGRCPLCDAYWDANDLREYLEQKLLKAGKAKGYQDKIKEASSNLLEYSASITSSLGRTVSLARVVAEKLDLSELEEWHATLQKFSEEIRTVPQNYQYQSHADIGSLFALPNIDELLKRILSAAQARYPKVSPLQTAWDTLTRLEVSIRSLETAELGLQQARRWSGRATLLLSSFESARDKVLAELYETIRDRFVGLYRALHNTDEDGFTAILEPDGAGLSLEVDFYGHGTHPPHALHSEGHQDSMGLCLYLALAEHLTSGLVNLVILDDVVMSVDSDHRRQLCTVLASEFGDRQFVITTHDRNWAAQLRTEGVVTSAGSVEFFGWSVDAGPQVNHEVDLWARIEHDLSKGDVPSAAAKLRRGTEEYLSTVCDALGARVPFKLSQRYELGDLVQSVMHRCNELLGKAKKSAGSWGDTERLMRLAELESVAACVFKRTYAEQWAVNPNVHYSQWITFEKDDFVPVKDAFRDLFDVFRCSTCGSVARVLTVGAEDVAVRCSCGKFDWNLSVKPKH